MTAAQVDSLNLEDRRFSRSHSHISKVSWGRTIALAFQSVGVIYGDIGTSPLYVYSSTFPNGIQDKEDLLGVLSLIIYTIVVLPMLKYVFIVLWANGNGDGLAMGHTSVRVLAVGTMDKSGLQVAATHKERSTWMW
ncbi:Potassium transporter 5 [Ancistrocladus abbreviatus]